MYTLWSKSAFEKVGHIQNYGERIFTGMLITGAINESNKIPVYQVLKTNYWILIMHIIEYLLAIQESRMFLFIRRKEYHNIYLNGWWSRCWNMFIYVHVYGHTHMTWHICEKSPHRRAQNTAGCLDFRMLSDPLLSFYYHLNVSEMTGNNKR